MHEISNLFYWKNKIKIISLSSAGLAHRVVNVIEILSVGGHAYPTKAKYPIYAKYFDRYG